MTENDQPQFAPPSYPQAQPYPQSQAYPQYPQPGFAPSGPAPLGVPAPPPSNAGWAVAAVIFFWPLAFAAFNHSSSVFPKWATGDYAGAQYSSNRARELGRISLFVFVGLFAVFIAFYVILIVVAISSAGDSYY